MPVRVPTICRSLACEQVEAVLISHRYRFIYTKTVKTAGTSVESYFERFCMPEGEWAYSHAREEYESPSGIIGYRGPEEPPKSKWYNHMPAELIRQQIGTEIWNSYFKFCVIRDPFEKAISAFEHLGRNHAIPRGPRGLWFRLRHRGYTAEQLRFLHWLTLGRRAIDRDKYLIGATFCLDDVVRYESLETDLARICDRLGVAWEPARLPRLKSEFRRQTSTISRLYTAPALRLVAQAYDFEIARFGYEFPGGRRATMPDKTVVSDPPVLP